jgi:hypothetical protein
LLHFLLFLFKNPLVLLLLQLQEIVISTSQHSDESVALDQYQFATSISKSHHFKNQNEFIPFVAPADPVTPSEIRKNQSQKDRRNSKLLQMFCGRYNSHLANRWDSCGWF